MNVDCCTSRDGRAGPVTRAHGTSFHVVLVIVCNYEQPLLRLQWQRSEMSSLSLLTGRRMVWLGPPQATYSSTAICIIEIARSCLPLKFIHVPFSPRLSTLYNNSSLHFYTTLCHVIFMVRPKEQRENTKNYLVKHKLWFICIKKIR